MRNNVIRIYISSTFADFQAERNALRQFVFPELQILCQSHGLRFEPVDLRWGVSEQASENKEVLQICLAELQRCRDLSQGPYMLVLLGDRYGSQLVPEQIERGIFHHILTKLPAELADITRQCYRLDQNPYQPVYRLQRESDWPVSREELLSYLETGINKLEDMKVAALLASATEREILTGLSDNPIPEVGVICFFREIKQAKQGRLGFPWINVDQTGNVDKKALKRLKLLKEMLQKKGYTKALRTDILDGQPSKAYLDRFCNEVLVKLSANIEASIKENPILTSSQMEAAHQEQFMAGRSEGFVGRKGILKKMEQYLSGSSRYPLIVHGASGDGKSALLANIGVDLKRRENRLLYRFIGASPASSDGRSLLLGLCQELSALLKVDPPRREASLFQISQDFRQLMLAMKKPLTIIIDAVDQLTDDDESKYLTWIPPHIPGNIKMIISTTEGDKLSLLRQKGIPAKQFLKLPALSLLDSENIIKGLCQHYETNLSKPQRAMIEIGFRACRSPLFLYIAFQRARQWASYDQPHPLGSSPQESVNILLKELSQENNHGKLIVSKTLQWMSLSRFGLSHDELSRLLSYDEQIMKDVIRRHPESPTPGSTFPPILWFRLYYDLLPYLKAQQEGGSELFSFFHNVWFGVIKMSIRPSTEKKLNGQLAHCFSSSTSVTAHTESTGSAFDHRFLSECPYHQVKGKSASALNETLLNIYFMEAKIEEFGVQKLIDDYAFALNGFPKFRKRGSTIRELSNFLNRYADILNRNPKELAVHLLSEQSSAISPIFQKIAEASLQRDKEIWLKPEPLDNGSASVLRIFDFNQSVSSFFAEDQRQATSFRIWGIDSFQDGSRVIAAHHDGVLRILDMFTGRTEGVLVGHTNVVNAVAISPDQKTILSVSGDGKLIKWNAASYEKLWEVKTKESLFSVAIHPKLPVAATGGDKGTTWIWDVESKKLVKILKGHKQTVWQMCFDPTGEFLYSVSQDGSVKIRSVINWKVVKDDKHPGDVLQRAIDISKNNQYLAIGDGDGVITVFDVDTFSVLTCWRAHDSVIRDLAITPDAKKIISVSQDGYVNVFNLKNGHQTRSLNNHGGPVHAVNIHDKGKYFYTGDDSGKILIWDLVEVRRKQKESNIHSRDISKLVPMQNGEKLISASSDGQLAIWSTKSQKIECSKKVNIDTYNFDYLSNCHLSSDERHLIVLSKEMLFCLDLDTLHVRHKYIDNVEYFANFLSYKSDNNLVINIMEDSKLCWWSIPDLDMIQTVNLGHLAVSKFEMSADCSKILISAWDKVSYKDQSDIFSLILLTGKTRKRIKLPKQLRESLSISFLGEKNGISHLKDQTLCVWDLESRKILRQFMVNVKVACFSISSDNKHILTVSQEGILYRWNCSSDKYQQLANLGGTEIRDLQPIPNSSLLLFVSSNITLHLFDLQGAKLLSTFSVHSEISCFEILTGQNMIVLGETSGRIHFLRLER